MLTVSRRCLVVEANALSRFALCSLLADSFDVESLDRRSKAIDLVRDIGGFDVLLLDVCRHAVSDDGEPTGIEAIRAIRKREPGTGIVARGAHPARHLANEVLRAGALSYLSCDAGPEHVRKAALSAAEQEGYLDPAVPPKGSRGALTKRQLEILQMLSEGSSIAYSARALSLSQETVKTHMKHILARLGARNRAHAVAIALRDGLIE